MPPGPSAVKKEWPLDPEPSMTPSSQSTESTRKPKAMDPAEAVTPGVLRALSSKVSRKKVWPRPAMLKGLSLAQRYGVGPSHVCAWAAWGGATQARKEASAAKPTGERRGIESLRRCLRVVSGRESFGRVN